MSKDPATIQDRETLATADEIKHIFRNLDDAKLLAILALRPTILDLEQASMWLSGDKDVFGAGQPLRGVAGDIVAILTADEEEEQTRSR